MTKQAAVIYPSWKKNWIFWTNINFLERQQDVLFFQFRQARNLCRADRTSIRPGKLQLEFFIKFVKLILVID